MKSIFFCCLASVLLFTELCTPQDRACIPTYTSCMDECGNTRQCEQACVSEYEECASREYIFQIHYVIVTPNASHLTESDLRAEVDTLNKYFAAFDPRFPGQKRKIVHFEYKSATFLPTVQSLSSPVLDFLQSQIEHVDLSRTNEFQGYFDQESNQLIRDSTAINIYIYDNYSTVINNRTKLPWGWSAQNSHGRSSNNNPYNWIDYRRLGHRQAVEEHEMGHCFDVLHVCNPGAVSTTSTNIMSSACEQPKDVFHSAGDRSIAFNEDQVQQILRVAPHIMAQLND